MTLQPQKLKTGIFLSIIVLIGFLFIDYIEKYPLSINRNLDSWEGIWYKFCKLHKKPSFFVSVYTFVVWLIYQNFLYVKRIFQEFIFPMAIGIFTLFMGSVGFCKAGFKPVDAIFSAANLLTLNTSVFESSLGSKPTNFWIENARLAGGIFLIYAFGWALSRAMGRENFSRIQFWFFRNLRRKPFYVVIGDGEKAVALTIDLVNTGKKVAFLHQGFNENIESILEEIEIWYFKGNASAKIGLKKTYFQLAVKVYVLHDSDEENFRTIQEMDEICVKEPDNLNLDSLWFVNLKDVRKRSLLKNSMIRQRERIQTFYIEQNIARKLIHYNPIDGFSDAEKVAQIIILGFSDMAEAIVMQCLQQGHFTNERYIQIKVYFNEKETEKVKTFRNMHPEVFKNDRVFGNNLAADDIQNYTFFQHCNQLIDFEELPIAESELINPDFSLYSLIKPENKTSIYTCMDSGLDSASILGTILHRLSWLKTKYRCFIKVYCHYNFPDIEEEQEIERQLSALSQNSIEVYCFGNYLIECTATTIENCEIDLLAKQISLQYASLRIDYKKIDKIKQIEDFYATWSVKNIEHVWKEQTENDRESNKQAANHAFVKFREFGKDISNLPNDLSFFWGKDLSLLAELEHRRWCAEKLLLGWLPTHDTHLWKSNKKELKDQKLHLFLVPYNDLPETEKDKDYAQVIGLPYFMREIMT